MTYFCGISWVGRGAPKLQQQTNQEFRTVVEKGLSAFPAYLCNVFLLLVARWWLSMPLRRQLELPHSSGGSEC